MQEVFAALNRLVTNGVVDQYAIGGAMGAQFYIEAASTEDIDAFVFLPTATTGFVDLSAIYSALVAEGGKVDKEFIKLHGWPLQILTDANSLIAEAIRNAITLDYSGVTVRVFRPEYLCAVALQTGRAKDFLRVVMFLEQKEVDTVALSNLVESFGLQSSMSKVQALREASNENRSG